jgi:phosphate transport system substrate-binding protein
MSVSMRFLTALSALTFVVTACGRGGDSATSDSISTSGLDLTGAGATFPQPIYYKWTTDYAAATGVRINYQSIGSGGGIKQLQEGVVDFGASDSPMTDAEIAAAKHGPVLHFPTVLGAVVITYNLPNVTAPLRVSGQEIADIFNGTIKKWNDARLAALNPSIKLPSDDILVVHRSDGSGTTYIFTDYLVAASSTWATTAGGPGRGKEVNWKIGLGGKGNEGVAGQVKQTPGSIGYVELAYAKQNGLPVAHVRNAAGEFVEPTIASITAAAEGIAATLGADADYRISIVNGPGAGAYPISSLTWLLIYQTPPDAAKGKKIVDFMRWVYSTGQQSAASLDYAPLPAVMTQRLTDRLSSITLTATR